jgi:hypothetical protein
LTPLRETRSETDDVRATLDELRASVRRQAGYLTGEDVPSPAVSSAIAEAVDLAAVSAHLPVESRLPLVGRGVTFAKRVVRLGLRWYINPIVEQQNAFNEAVVRALIQLERRQSLIERRLESGGERAPNDES